MFRRLGSLLAICCLLLFVLGGLAAAQKKPNLKGAKVHNSDDRMSPMGQLAAKVNAAANGLAAPGIIGNNDFDKVGCDNPADCGDDDVPIAGGQAETSIAVDSTRPAHRDRLQRHPGV